jgi:hypothetical protein
MGAVSTYIRHQIAVIVTTPGDVNRHSSSFNITTVLTEWTKGEVRSLCLSKNFIETQGGYSAQETRIVDQRTRSSFARRCSTSQCCRNRESLELLGLENFSTSTTQSSFGTVGLSFIPEDEKAPQSSVLPLQRRCSK